MIFENPKTVREVQGGALKAVPLQGDELERETHFLIEEKVQQLEKLRKG